MAVRVIGSLLALLALPADGVAVARSYLRRDQHAVSPAMKRSWRQECGRAAGFSLAQRQPGAGMSPGDIEPFTTVLKDGFAPADCVKDYLFYHGDKFGDHKASYAIQERANISIVHYARHVPKEDRKPMTQYVCFEFCRSVPDMSYFGILNGRECYCAPYFQAMAGDSSSCHEVCEGDRTMMCGGKTKSSVFAMHLCDDSAEQLNKASERMDQVGKDLKDLEVTAAYAVKVLQGSGANLQEVFGKAGDPGAADLMQKAKVLAGVINKTIGRAQGLAASIEDMKGQADTAAAGDLSAATALSAAEVLLKGMGDATKQAQETVAELKGHIEVMEGIGMALDMTDAAKQYYPTMYFVDKQYEAMPATCTGTASEKPIVASLEACARACDHDVHECVGFSHFEGRLAGTTWHTLYSTGALGDDHSPEETFNRVYREHAASGDNIIKRECLQCGDSHKTVYMRRFDDPTTYNAYQDLIVTWRGDSGFHTTFDLFSSLEDALNRQNPWTFCNGNDPTVAFPRDCGANGYVPMNWNGFHPVSRQPDFAFSVRSVETAGACFLFSKMDTITYYTGCPEQLAMNVTCYAKLSKHVGTSLAPDASGKCAGCLKEAKQAARCYE